MTDHLKIRRDGAVLEITFARREKKNALERHVP
jgi:enoyl-CoA hydratase/carnithine racemase